MSALSLAAATLLVSDFFSTRTLGEATLIAVGAVVLGFVVAKLWPKTLNPELFGFLAALLVVGALAYLGSAGAGLALVIVVVIGAALAFAGVMW